LAVFLLQLPLSVFQIEPVAAQTGGLQPRGPIIITGDNDFTEANGVTSGSGTAGDPYIIENWAIDASGGTAYGFGTRVSISSSGTA